MMVIIEIQLGPIAEFYSILRLGGRGRLDPPPQLFGSPIELELRGKKGRAR